ncbi:MAG: molybdopterin-guanine dinucleotide biosynthesis protein B [Burkholderiales bacterium]
MPCAIIDRCLTSFLMKPFGFAGWSGSGKTTLIEQLIPRFVAAGVRVSVVKHAHHDFDTDQPGKDSWRHRRAGATEVLVTAARRWVLMHELREAREPTLAEHMTRLAPCDLLLVEGFKHEPIPKLEIHRRALGKPVLWDHDGDIVAVATDEPLETPLPQLPLDDVSAIAAFVLNHVGLTNPPS